MLSYAQDTVITSAPAQSVYALIANPVSFFSALGHFWIWGAFDRSSHKFKPFVEAHDPDPQRIAGVLVLSIEGDKGVKPHVTEVEIAGPTLSGLELAYRVKSFDERVIMAIRARVQSSDNSNRLMVDIEASYVLDWKSLFLSPILGGKFDLELFIKHLIEVHLKGYVKRYLEQKAIEKRSVEPIIHTVEDVKNVVQRLNDLSKGINKGLISITGRDFVLVLEVEGGSIKDALYREGSRELRGAEAISAVSTKSGRVHLRVYDVGPEDVLFRLATG